MIARLFRYHEVTYLSLDTGRTVVLNSQEIKDFLKNYASESFYASLSSETDVDSILTEGELLAEVNEKESLVIYNSSLIRESFEIHDFPYLTTEEYATKHNRKQSIVLRLCRDGRLEGAIQKNTVWLIPADTPYPSDARVGIRVPSARAKKAQENI